MRLYELFGRLTPEDEFQATYNLALISAVFDIFSDKYFIAYEVEASRPHYHFLVHTELSAEALRYRLHKELYCQVYISGKEVRDRVRSIAYCMKEGTWIQKGMDINDILLASATSFKKNKFDDILKDIIKEYQDEVIKDDKWLVGKLVDANIKCNRKIYPQHIKSLALLLKLKSAPDNRTREHLIEKIVDEL